MSKNWSGYSTAHSVDSKKGPANYHFSKHQKPKDRHSSISTSECFFCENWNSNNPYFIQNVINRALYLKNFSLQKFFYTKDLNDILARKKNSKVINFKDMQCYYDEREFLRQYYDKGEYEKRITRLGEYYKFHQDIPRMFIPSTAKIYGFYHDSKRRIDYFRISKMLRERDQPKNAEGQNNVDQAGKKGVDSTIADKVLVGLDDITALETRKSSIAVSSMVFTNKATTDNSPRKAICSKRPVKKSQLARKNSDTERSDIDKRVDTVEDKSISKSIIELNMKLGEIINRSYSQSLDLDITSCFEQSSQQLNEIIIGKNNNLFQLVDEKEKNKKKSPLKTHTQNRPSVASEYYSQKLTNQDFDSVKASNNEDQNPIAIPLVSSATNQQAFRSSEWFQSLKKTVPSNLIRKRPNRLICTSRERIGQESRNALSSAKYSVDSVAISQNFNKSVANFAKIKNFEEANRRKQYNASAEIRGHRSTSRDKTYQYPNNSSFLDKNGGQGCKTQRDMSDENHVARKTKKIDLLKTKIKLSGSNNLTYRDKRVNMFNKNSGSGSQHFESQQMMMTADKDIYTSVNIKDLTQQVNQQGHKFISNTMQNVKVTTKYGNIPVYQSVKENRKSHIMSTDRIVQETIQDNSGSARNPKEDVAIAVDSVYKTLVIERPVIMVRGSTENLRKSKALTHRDRDYELMPSREGSSEKNKKVTMYVMMKKEENKASASDEKLDSPDSDELRKFTIEEKKLKNEKSSKDLVKFFVEPSQTKKVKKHGEDRQRRAISTEKFRPGIVGMVSSQSQHKLSGIAINSMRDHHEMNKDINNLYEKIYAKYAQGMSLKSVPKEGFLKAKAKGEMGKDGKVVVSTRCVKVDLHNSKEIMLGNSVENEKNIGENYGMGGQVKKEKRKRKNTVEM